MTSLFIHVDVAPGAAADPAVAGRLVDVCPVDVYSRTGDGALRVVDENVDECVLCRLCVEAAPPGAVTVRTRYGGRVLAS